MGGLASALGSRWVERQRLIRAERTHMYRDLLPQLVNAKEHRLTANEWLSDLGRSAVLAGRKDDQLARELVDAWKRPGKATGRTPQAADERLDAAFEALQTHLDRKLRRRI